MSLPDTQSVAPSAGDERALGADELFFSTTDARGVIQQGNSVFVRISGYSLDEIVGAPHNLVRHPDMPAGVFRIMWAWLEAGRPVGAYVCNRTKDGGHYWVFAVVSPLADGFLSVRMAPQSAALAVVQEMYAEARAVEARAAAAGAGRREVAEAGEAALLSALLERGFDSYEDFMHAALPAEIWARTAAGAAGFQRPSASGQIKQVLDGSAGVSAVLGNLVAQLRTYQKLGNELAQTTDRVLAMTDSLQGSVVAAQEASTLMADARPVLANVANVMAQPMNEAISDLEKLPVAFRELRADIDRLRFQISVATLYTDMAAAFAAEVHDGVAPEDSLSAVPLLCDAVDTCVEEMVAQVQAVNADLRGVATLSTEAGQLLEDFRKFIGQWRQLVFRYARLQLSEHVTPIDEQIASTWGHAAQLQGLSQQASAAILPFDPADLRRHVATMRVSA